MMDAEALDKHLRETPWFIEQHRARIKPNDYSYSDDIMAPNGFGPKSPGNDNAIMFADYEAQTIGRLASYCQNIGSIPHFPLDGFWWSRGRCMGMKHNGLRRVSETCQRLRAHVGDVLNTEGVDEYLYAMESARGMSVKMFPNEDENWLTMDEAVDFTGRDKRTIYRWIEAGGMPTLDDRWGLMISKAHLQMKMGIVHANMLRNLNYGNQYNPKRSSIGR